MRDKVAIITGGSSGIGKETAKRLADRGTKTVLLARDMAKLDAARNEFKDRTRVTAVQADVTDRNSLKSAVAQVVAAHGSIDIVVNCAGSGYFGPVVEMTEEAITKLVRTNVFGPVLMVQESLEALKRSRGTIVNISSGLSKRALPYLSVYGGTKAMQDQISDGLRMELRDTGIRVLSYGPPATDTPFLDVSAPDTRSRMSSFVKLAKPQDVAARIVKAIEGDKREVNEGGFLKAMNFFAPGVLDTLFYKWMVRKPKT